MDYNRDQIDSILREANRLRSEEVNRLTGVAVQRVKVMIGTVMTRLAHPLRHAHR
ncbi:hypothetical protein J5J83_21860 [Azoarcus sp. L1K30]|uniref:hypothetical protein n=1 Tax=Azoarcus sp. L1K30 TaxID=2820277 RepID=UPI001B817C66|nr:hypothetical protein [Azoarcus sp. L1K30]MBR0568779.1 hypothetical protein [Azoarcus sp. L1K30]